MQRKVGGLLAFAVATVICGLQAQAGDGKSDKDLIQGAWEMVSMKIKGMEIPVPKEATITFKGDKAIANKNGKDDPADYKLDPTKKPKEIDIKAEKEEMKGIYEFQGDTIRLAFDFDKSGRPKDFTGDNVVIMTLKKKK